MRNVGGIRDLERGAKLEGASRTYLEAASGYYTEGPSGLSRHRGEDSVTTTHSTEKTARGRLSCGPAEAAGQGPRPRAMRADAKRNYDKVVAAAREPFAEKGAVDLARGRCHDAPGWESARSTVTSRPGRRCSRPSTSVRSRAMLRDPGAARPAAVGRLLALSHRLVTYLATKKALAHELMQLRRPRGRLLPDAVAPTCSSPASRC